MTTTGNPDDGPNRDPGASLEEAGIPEYADDMQPDGDVPDPGVPSVPVDAPTYGLLRVEEEETLDQRLAEEEPDPAQDPDLYETADEDDADPTAGLPVPEEAGLDEEVDAELAGDDVTGMHIETEPGP
ncbi:hypothetical protein E1212_20330 [Jiangella ureilytica]|uniref:DUF5709 domain-containing protein n=1 Tax=Jiangella ureilytica TaxID=2530374 RepID=A0A4R4RJR7_9ACTN|nr:hypothetical protein [Jiangella ureilytica]TDC48723.1 hypothetical protein E1212_20330 [Jiangella ureilytica]